MIKNAKRDGINIRSALALAVVIVGISVSSPGSAKSSDTIRFGHASWPGVTVKTQVVIEILETLGYETSKITGQQTVLLNGLRKDLDINMEAWRPVQTPLMDKLIATGEVTAVVKNLKDAVGSALAVPEYVHESGVTSIADLNGHAEKFERKIYTIDAGGVLNVAVREAIEADLYNLGEWTDVPSSTAAMLAQVERLVGRKKWVVFTAWRPHWMNVVYDLKFLDDPEGLYPKEGTGVYTVANTGFLQENPNVARLLEQIVVTSEIQSQWIYRYGYKDVDAETVAEEWIRSHLQKINGWLDGVSVADESSEAKVAIRERFREDSE